MHNLDLFWWPAYKTQTNFAPNHKFNLRENCKQEVHIKEVWLKNAFKTPLHSFQWWLTGLISWSMVSSSNLLLQLAGRLGWFGCTEHCAKLFTRPFAAASPSSAISAYHHVQLCTFIGNYYYLLLISNIAIHFYLLSANNIIQPSPPSPPAICTSLNDHILIISN